MSRLRWPAPPPGATPRQKRNFFHVQIDAAGVALATAAGPFLAVFLTRLGATTLQISLLTAMPALAGLLFSIPIGQFLQSRRNVVPWYGGVRLLALSAYTLTGIVPFLVPRRLIVPAVLLVWMAVTIPQTLVGVAFSVVMSGAAAPRDRYALMSRRWSLMSLLKTIVVIAVGSILDATAFPVNYQLTFAILSLGGLVSFFGARRIELPDAEPAARAPGLSLRRRIQRLAGLVRGKRDFNSFVTRRFVFALGGALAAPLFPIYYVREVGASDAWIGVFSSVQTAVVLLGYALWTRQNQARGSRFVLLSTTFAMALYPALVASTRATGWITLFSGLAGLFQAGLGLAFFDGLMKTVPPGYGPTFVSLSQSLLHFASVVAPLLGTALADRFGIRAVLLLSAAIRLAAFGLFAWKQPRDG